MESKIIFMFIGFLVITLLLLTSLVFLFWKRTRKTGLWMSSILVLIIVGFGIYYFTPRHFKRNYISKVSGLTSVTFRGDADSLHFYIGAAGDIKIMNDPRFYENFNSITPENGLKMRALLKNGEVGAYDFSHADSLVDLALREKIRVRGHTLVWGKLSDMFKAPDLELYLKKFPEKERSKALWDVVQTYITTVLNHFRGRIRIWDLVNEPLQFLGSGGLEKNVYYRHLGEEYIAKSFRLAHTIDPNIKLYLNEQLYGYNDKRSEFFYNLVKKLKDEHVPIDGVGIQSHVVASDFNLEEFERYLKRLSDLGVEVEITELDARLMLFKSAPDPYEAQGEFYGKLLDICLSNPSCKGVTFWGFSDNHSWYDNIRWFPKPNEPYLFDKDMHPKPAFEKVYQALHQHLEKRNEK